MTKELEHAAALPFGEEKAEAMRLANLKLSETGEATLDALDPSEASITVEACMDKIRKQDEVMELMAEALEEICESDERGKTDLNDPPNYGYYGNVAKQALDAFEEMNK